jgi:hypothetical protein
MGRLGIGRWSLKNGLHCDDNLTIKSEPDKDGDARILGSPFQTSTECVRLGHGKPLIRLYEDKCRLLYV